VEKLWTGHDIGGSSRRFVSCCVEIFLRYWWQLFHVEQSDPLPHDGPRGALHLRDDIQNSVIGFGNNNLLIPI
jgi:hypothetical protein